MLEKPPDVNDAAVSGLTPWVLPTEVKLQNLVNTCDHMMAGRYAYKGQPEGKVGENAWPSQALLA